MAKDTLRDRVIDNLLSQISSLTPMGARAKPSEHGAPLISLLDNPLGWNRFLKTVGRGTFSGDFSPFHTRFWNWYWELTRKRYHDIPFGAEDKLTYLPFFGRGNGKSSIVEWAAILEGAMGLKGYVLYVGDTQANANAHVLSIRKRLESEDISRYFPHLSEPQIGKHGDQFGWRQEFLITKGGWAIRPVGLDVGIRGSKSGDLRPTLIIFDDIDSHDQSLAVIKSNIETISRVIVPAGTANTISLFAQNIIHENSIANQLYTHRTDILANHIIDVVPAFDPETLDIQTTIDQVSGETRHLIHHAEPNWEHFDTLSAQRFLDKSGLFSFMAEYQHDFSLDAQDKVLPEYLDYPTHVITWEQFEERFKTKNTVPAHWQKGVGLDLGYTDTHLSAWTWLAVGAVDSGLPNAHFIYRGLTYVNHSINDQAEQVLGRLRVNTGTGTFVNEFEQGYSVQRMSHEKLGEKLILNREYDFSFSPAKKGKEEGIPEWRTLLRVDHTQPHPFHQHDRQLTDDECEKRGMPRGSYEIGRPNFFMVVHSSQIVNPFNDDGLAVHRAQMLNWRRRKVNLTVTGLSDDQPMKVEDDTCDATRMVLAERILSAEPYSPRQMVENMLTPHLKSVNLKDSVGKEDFGGILLARQMEVAEASRRVQDQHQRILDAITRVGYVPTRQEKENEKRRRRPRMIG